MRQSSFLTFFGLLLVAVVLQILQLPDFMAPARPLCVVMLFALWTYVSPRNVSLLLAWVTGLSLDVLLNTVLGQHALGLVLVVYVVSRLRKLLLVIPFLQTALALAPVWAGYAFLMFWIDGAREQQADPSLRWLPVLSTTLLWPFLFPLLNRLGKPSRE